MKKFIRSRDRTAPEVQDEFHFDGGSYNKTFIGGFLSLTVTMFLLYFVSTSFISIIRHKETYY